MRECSTPSDLSVSMCEQSRKRVALFGAFLSVLCAPAQADMALAQSRNCLSCHAIDKKVVGPAFKDIAARYANDKGAADRLTARSPEAAAAPGAWWRCPPTRGSHPRKRKNSPPWVHSQK